MSAPTQQDSAMPMATWVAVDWGTSNLRAWVFGPDDQQIAELSSDQGMSGLTPDQFEPVLLSLVGAYLPPDRSTPVVACGMVGAAQGWAMAPYDMVPCPPPGIDRATTPVCHDPRIDMRILPGVAQQEPADVMRGEETQIAGLLSSDTAFDGVACLPGTHSKWARIRGGKIAGFKTFMSGELFALLSGQSVLRHSIDHAAWDIDAFERAVADVIAAPQSLYTDLFSLRAGVLLGQMQTAEVGARLSGLLIGAELAAARSYWQGQRVVIIGASRVASLYQTALISQGIAAETLDVAAMTKVGLRATYRAWKKVPA